MNIQFHIHRVFLFWVLSSELPPEGDLECTRQLHTEFPPLLLRTDERHLLGQPKVMLVISSAPQS